MRAAAACLVAVTGLAVPLLAADPPTPIDQRISLPKELVGAALKDVLIFLGDKAGLATAVDDAAFRKVGVKDVADLPIRLPRMDAVPLSVVFQMVAQQAGGMVQVRGNQVSNVPGKTDLAAVLPPATNALTKKLAENVTIADNITRAKVGELVAYLHSKAGVSIVIAEWQFPSPPQLPAVMPDRRPADSWISGMPCRVTSGTEPLRTWLDALAGRIGGTVVPRGDVVLILAASKG